jgi:hypothetical protein
VGGNGTLLVGITDQASVVLRREASPIDAVCFYCGTNPFDGTYTCEGSPFVKTSCSSNLDRSLERKPGGAGGNATDTGDSANDFQVIEPSNPQNLASPATP